MSDLYAADGVDIAAGDEFSAFAAKLCAHTHNNSPFVRVCDLSAGHFRGPGMLTFEGLCPGWGMAIAADGLGTKSSIISAALSHYTAGYDLLAMLCGDLTRYGHLPVVFSNVLDTATLGKAGDRTNLLFRRLIEGLVAAAHAEGVVLYRGETAELGICVGSDDLEAVTKFNWAGFAIGISDPKRTITGERLRPGQRIVALREHGFRSNGMSSVREALRIRFGNEWWKNPGAGAHIEAAAAPSVLYDPLLTYLNGWRCRDFVPAVNVHGISHITGGGIKSKFAEDLLFGRGLSAELDDLFDPPPIMRSAARWRGMSDEECYAVWNGGQGVLMIVDEIDVNAVRISASNHGIEAKECGRIMQQHMAPPSVCLKSKFSVHGDIEYVYSRKK